MADAEESNEEAPPNPEVKPGPPREKHDVWLQGMEICAIDCRAGLLGSTEHPPVPEEDCRKPTHRGEVCVLECKVGNRISLGTAALVITDCEPEKVRWLLTGAHCVTYVEDGELKMVPEMRIRVPSWKPAIKGQTMPVYTPGADAAWEDQRFDDYFLTQDDVWIYPEWLKNRTTLKGTDIALLKLPEISKKEKEQVPRLVIWDRRKQPGRVDGLYYSPYEGMQYKQITDKTPVNTGYVPRPILHKSMKKLLRMVMKHKTEEQLHTYLNKKRVPEDQHQEKIDAIHEHIKGLKAFREAGGDLQHKNIHFHNMGNSHWLIRFKKLTTKSMSGGPIYLDCMMGGICLGQDDDGNEIATALTMPVLDWIHETQLAHGAEGRLFQNGAWVKIVGLTKKPELNGRVGSVCGPGTQPDRLSIVCGHSAAYSIRRRNLEPTENPMEVAMRDPGFRDWQQKVQAYNSPPPESDESDTPELELFDRYTKEPLPYETKRQFKERMKKEEEERKKKVKEARKRAMEERKALEAKKAAEEEKKAAEDDEAMEDEKKVAADSDAHASEV